VAEKKNRSAAPNQNPAKIESANDLTLGQSIVEMRERKGLSQDDVVRETHLPIHYVKMIESDTYGAIADQLYVLPFLRRYATFLGLDAEEVASRFIRDVQRSETNVTRMSEPITMVTKKTGRWRGIAFGLLVVAILVLLADFALRNFDFIKRVIHPTAAASPAVALPGSTIVTSVSPAAEAPSAAESPAVAAAPAMQSAPIAAATAPAPAARATFPPQHTAPRVRANPED
jgi:cytoskeleton protein RodZ